jgi:hypothetical protein
MKRLIKRETAAERAFPSSTLMESWRGGGIETGGSILLKSGLWEGESVQMARARSR